MSGKSIWGLWWTNFIGAVSLQAFRFFPVSYRPTNPPHSLSSPDTQKAHNTPWRPGSAVPTTLLQLLWPLQQRTQLSWQAFTPAPQTLQSAINITCKIFIFVDASHEYLPTQVLQAFQRVTVWNSTIRNDSIANHLDVLSCMRMWTFSLHVIQSPFWTLSIFLVR
jgi:hypothetical protein